MFATVVVFAVVSSGLLLAQSDPYVGTWKLNVSKSKYVTAPTPKSQTRTYDVQGDVTKVSTEGVNADGTRVAYSLTTNFDGKDSPLSGVGPNGGDTMAVKRVDANTATVTIKKAGKVVVTARNVVSKDGKVLTTTTKGTNEQGQPTSTTQVYDKQ